MPERKISIHNHVMPRVVTDRIRELAPPDGGRWAKNHFCPDCGSTVHMLLLPEPSLSSSQDRGKVPRARQCGRVHARIWEIKRLRVHDFDSGIPPWRESPFRNGQHTPRNVNSDHSA